MPDQTQQFSFKVLTINIHKGFTAFNRRFILPELRDAVRTVSADIVCLQEVMGAHEVHPLHVENWPDTSHYEFLADTMWSDFAYGRNAVYPEGHHGNAVLSRYPIEHYENRDVSVDGAEKRGVLYCRIVPPMTGKARPRNQQGMARTRQSSRPFAFFLTKLIGKRYTSFSKCTPNGSMSCRTANQYWWRVISTTGGKKLIIR